MAKRLTTTRDSGNKNGQGAVTPMRYLPSCPWAGNPGILRRSDVRDARTRTDGRTCSDRTGTPWDTAFRATSAAACRSVSWLLSEPFAVGLRGTVFKPAEQ